MAIKS